MEIIRLAVQQFDHRFIPRALRSVSSIRKKLATTGNGLGTINSIKVIRSSASSESTNTSHSPKKSKLEAGALIPEEEVYLAVLEQVSCFNKANAETINLTQVR